jgi:hypothetical protein
MKLSYKRIYSLLIGCTAATLWLTACKKNVEGGPVITEVRNYDAAPNDTLISSINTGQWVVLSGSNLGGVTQVFFGSTPATINNTLLTGNSIVVQVPAIPFQLVQRDKINEIKVVSANGTATYTINITGAPLISYVRNNAPSPNDTIVQSIVPGQKISLIGYNFKNPSRIAFQGVAANLAGVTVTDSSAVVQVPADLSGGDVTQANMIIYTTPFGTDTFSIQIIGPPLITRVSNENANAGDSVYLYGNNFFGVQHLTYAGVAITSYKAAADGNSIGFILPTLTQGGPVSITTAGGTFTSAYNVNDVTTGIISNFEWGDNFHWDWWGGANLASGDANFPGNSTQYIVLKTNVMNSGDGADWTTAIRIGGVQWLPAGNVNDPVTAWALKFEISIPAGWKGGSLMIKSANGNYMARYEPWQVSATTTEAYSTKGWQTLTIPFTSFRKKDATLGDGKGESVASITDLVGSTGKSDLYVYMHNYSAAPTATGFNGAFDNFRVVKR